MIRALVLPARQGIGRTDKDKYNSEDLSSFKAHYSNVGHRMDVVRLALRAPAVGANFSIDCWLALIGLPSFPTVATLVVRPVSCRLVLSLRLLLLFLVVS